MSAPMGYPYAPNQQMGYPGQPQAAPGSYMGAACGMQQQQPWGAPAAPYAAYSPTSYPVAPAPGYGHPQQPQGYYPPAASQPAPYMPQHAPATGPYSSSSLVNMAAAALTGMGAGGALAATGLMGQQHHQQHYSMNHAGPHSMMPPATGAYPGGAGSFSTPHSASSYSSYSSYGSGSPLPHAAAVPPPAAGAGTAAGAVVVSSPEYVSQQRTELILQEGAFLGQKDNFDIRDHTGRTYFQLEAKHFSMGNRRTLKDAYGRPCLLLDKKLVSLHNSWVVLDASGSRQLATVKNALMSFTPNVKVYLFDGDHEEDYLIKGDFRARRFDILQTSHSHSGPRLVATVKKESKFASLNSFMMSMATDADKYFLSIEPGVDMAFMVALATLVDELFHDNKE